jgi:hypothetical protein
LGNRILVSRPADVHPVRNPNLRTMEQPVNAARDAGRKGRQLPLILLGIATVVVQCVLWISARRAIPTIAREHGPMENFQAASVFLGFLLLLVAVVRSERPAPRILFGGLALLYFTFLMLEIDFRTFAPKPVLVLLRGTIRDVWLGILWVGAGWAFLRHRRQVLEFFFSWIRTDAGVAMIFAGCFWVLGGVFDKAIFKGKDLFAEELMESNAGLFMLASAALTVWRNRAGTSTRHL